MKVSLETILAEIAAAGPVQEPEGERLKPFDLNCITDIIGLAGKWSDLSGVGYSACADVADALRQLRSDLVRLAAEIGRRDAVLRVILDVGEDGWNLKLALAMDEARKILEPLK